MDIALVEIIQNWMDFDQAHHKVTDELKEIFEEQIKDLNDYTQVLWIFHILLLIKHNSYFYRLIDALWNMSNFVFVENINKSLNFMKLWLLLHNKRYIKISILFTSQFRYNLDTLLYWK